VKFLSDLGVDVYAIINQIHDILGFPPFVPRHSTRRGVGINGLIEDLLAVLPLEELKALFDLKLETSEYFKALVEGIQSEEFAVSIHCVYLSYVSCCLWYVHTSV
jgi:hypothetical protein